MSQQVLSDPQRDKVRLAESLLEEVRRELVATTAPIAKAQARDLTTLDLDYAHTWIERALE